MTLQAYQDNSIHLTASTDLAEIYNQFLCSRQLDLQKAQVTQSDQDLIPLAERLIENAKNMDIQKVEELLATRYHGSISRDFNHPVFYEHESIIDQPWSDKRVYPLQPGEEWNKNNRATVSGIPYSFDKRGYPQCPYINFGIDGRGIIGRYGPNHAVDLGILQIRKNKDSKNTLHALGIIRKDSGKPALCGGFTNFEKQPDGTMPYTKQIMVDTQASEFFFFFISGSITLTPEYTEGLQEEIKTELTRRSHVQNRMLFEKEIDLIKNQITTHRKLLQVENEDPQFLKNVRQTFSNANECYAGPVLTSARNTNNAWMETRLSWFALDNQKWDAIKGDDQFNYAFKAGDDAADVIWHDITPDLIDTCDSHASLFCYLLGSYLLTANHDPETLPDLKQQAAMLNDHMENRAKPDIKPLQSLKI